MGDILTKCGGDAGHSDDDDDKDFSPFVQNSRRNHDPEYKDLGRNFRDSLQVTNSSASDFYGFHFNNSGQLVDNKGCSYNLSKQKNNGSDFYSNLCEKVTRFVQELLVDVYGLKKITIPFEAAPEEPLSFIFASSNALTTTDKLLILIHGSGNVAAGIWSRKVIVTDNLYRGSQISYIERALSNGFEIVIMNTNVNSQLVQCYSWVGEAPIRGSKTPEEHAIYVWDNFVLRSKAQNIAIVAHSYGGVVTTQLAARRKENFLKRVFAVAFTDSVHRLDRSRTPDEVVRFFCDNAKNWVSSDYPLDTPVGKWRNRPLGDAPRVSAGDSRHEWTSHSACGSVFTFFQEKYQNRNLRVPAAATDNEAKS